jgi:hypothetical protein
MTDGLLGKQWVAGTTRPRAERSISQFLLGEYEGKEMTESG